ncbi:MAG: hypothetical protein KZQ94_16115 [Candidatus Thiodiazotropha sp. (ex Troendleina suluensis)]|nr:hypothetical protein [Candidatus Thiodiazotropha sp. (ex Troendleina suluensis)]
MNKKDMIEELQKALDAVEKGDWWSADIHKDKFDAMLALKFRDYRTYVRDPERVQAG